MSLLTRVRSWLYASLHRADLDRSMNDELRFHIEAYADDLERRGLSSEEASRRARAEFGSVDARKEECREALGLRLLDELRADLRYAVRLLRRSPAFTTVAVLSLGLGIGANTAIFSLVDRLILRTIPVEDPWRLLEVNRTGPGGQGPVISYPTYRFLRDHNSVFTDIAATGRIRRWSVMLSAANEPERLAGELVSANYFSLLGVRPAIGRMLTPDDDVAAGVGGLHGAVAVLSHDFWRRRFAAHPGVLGQTLRIAGTPVTVVGVAGPGFPGIEIADPVDVWVPMALQPQLSLGQNWLDQPGSNWLRAIGRLKPGVSREQAREASNAVFAQLPNAQGQEILLDDAAYGLSTLRERVSFSLVLLMGAVVLVLLIACANVANLFLVRASRRHREVTLRVALGASRARLVRQLLTESLLLALAGAMVGLVFAHWTTRALALVLLPTDTLSVSPGLDVRVLAFTLGLTLLTSLLFGMAPALEGARVDLAGSSRQGAGADTPATRRFSNALVILQVALSVLLLVGAGLFAQTLRSRLAVDTGFEQTGVLVARLDPLATGRSAPQLTAIHGELLDRVLALPGVRAASWSDRAPLSGGVRQRSISVLGFLPKPEDDLNPFVVSVSPLFFETMGIPLIRGRAFTPADEPNASRVAIVNASFARYYFGSDDALGRRFGFGGAAESDQVEIVGVAQDSKLNDLLEKPPHVVYVPASAVFSDTVLAVRYEGDALGMAPAVRRAIQAVDSTLPIVSMTTLRQQVERSLGSERFTALVSTMFGTVAMFLACIGLYGVTAYSVSRRTKDIGIRIALGASRTVVVQQILKESLMLVLVGVAIAIPTALALTGVFSSRLFGVQATDPWTFSAAIVLMFATGAVATWLPARRAAHVNPMVVLHEG